MTRLLIIAAALAFGIARPFVPTGSPSLLVACYKDAAHIFVGGLLGAWLASRTGICSAPNGTLAYWRASQANDAKFCLCVAVILSIVELFCFFGKRAFG